MMENKVKAMGVIQIRNVPDDLHAEFHAKCIQERKTMREKLLEFMEAYVSGKEPKEKRSKK